MYGYVYVYENFLGVSNVSYDRYLLLSLIVSSIQCNKIIRYSKKYCCKLGGLTLKYCEVIDCKMVCALASNEQTMYIFATALRWILRVSFEVQKLKEINYVFKYPFYTYPCCTHSCIECLLICIPVKIFKWALKMGSQGHHICLLQGNSCNFPLGPLILTLQAFNYHVFIESTCLWPLYIDLWSFSDLHIGRTIPSINPQQFSRRAPDWRIASAYFTKFTGESNSWSKSFKRCACLS